MKKIAFISFLALSVLLALIIVLNPQPVSGSKKFSPNGPGTALPDSVLKFVQKVCMDCHADDGNFMAKGKVNFSGWDKYDAEKQVAKAQASAKNFLKAQCPRKNGVQITPQRCPPRPRWI